MSFIPISIEAYVKKHLGNNPSESESGLRSRLNAALIDYQKGKRYSCGNDIWVVGSASLGNKCYECITGDSNPDDDYEIDLALNKRDDTKGRRNIDEIEHKQINGFFDDDGFEIKTSLMKKPPLCSICVKNDNPKEEQLCNMTRYDQKESDEFKCFAFIRK